MPYKTLSHQVADLEHNAKVLEDQNRVNQQELLRKDAKIRRLQNAAPGNAILIRRDGFSKALYLEPNYERDAYLGVDRGSSTTISFVKAPNKDEFGRAIYEEV